jgi:hypothetical protein
MSVAFVVLPMVLLAESTAATPARSTFTHVSEVAFTRSGGVTKSAVTGKVIQGVAILFKDSYINMDGLGLNREGTKKLTYFDVEYGMH